MNKRELKKKLSEAKQYRYYAQYAETLAILHQIVAEYPEAVYYYLLAATYLEAGEKDLAMQYLDEALNIDTNHKEAYELKAKVYESEKKYNEAEQMYLKALEIDPDFFNARKGLVDLYFKKEKNYEETIQQCEFVFNRYELETFNEYELKIKYDWFISFKNPLYSAYVYKGRYNDAIRVLNRDKEVIKEYIGKGKDSYTLASQDRILYKLYYLLKSESKLNEFRERWKNYYRMSDSYILGLEKDAEQGYILNTNRNNYEIAPDGTIL